MRKDDEKEYRKKPGRPRWSGQFTSSKCDVRLTSEENAMLNQLAEKNEVSRSEVVRKALRDFYKFNTDE